MMQIKNLTVEKERIRYLTFQFWKVQSKEEALYVIKQCSLVFLFLGGGLHILVGFLSTIAGLQIGIPAMINGVIYLILGLLLLFLKSRVIAILLLLISGIGLIGTVLGPGNILLATILFYFAIGSVYTTFKIS